MSRSRIGQEAFGFPSDGRGGSSLEELSRLVDWAPVEQHLACISNAAKGEAARPPLALFKALLLSIWYDLADVKLAEALDDRSSFRRVCEFSRSERTPERTAFVRFKKALVAKGLDRLLFDEIAAQLRAKSIKVKTGTLDDATIITIEGQHRWHLRCHYSFSTKCRRVASVINHSSRLNLRLAATT